VLFFQLDVHTMQKGAVDAVVLILLDADRISRN